MKNRFGVRDPHMYRPTEIPNDILPMCDALHCHTTGSADPMSDEELSLCQHSLLWVVENWRPTIQQAHALSENAILALCVSVLEESGVHVDQR